MITRHGQPVAELVRVVGRDVEQIRRAMATLRAIRRTLVRRGVAGKDALRAGQSLRELAHEGHRR